MSFVLYLVKQAYCNIFPPLIDVHFERKKVVHWLTGG
jgi:hypothetical protein